MLQTCKTKRQNESLKCVQIFFLIKNRTGELRTGNINSDLYQIC